MTDLYQKRYLEHQARKRRTITGEPNPMLAALRARRSQRVFNEQTLSEAELHEVYEAIRFAPSSCNRQAILIKLVEDADSKTALARLLVGGRGWLDGAAVVLLLFADMLAYKAPGEETFMPYLDAGFAAENVYLAAEALSIGACYVNPNVREGDRAEFDRLFNPRGYLFCGAVALSRYDAKAPAPPKRNLEEIFYR
jgi:nitroreductase